MKVQPMVGVRDLRARLNAYLRSVSNGATITLGGIDAIPSRVVPASKSPDRGLLDRIADQGVLRRSVGNPGQGWRAKSLRGRRLLSDIVIEEPPVIPYVESRPGQSLPGETRDPGHGGGRVRSRVVAGVKCRFGDLRREMPMAQVRVILEKCIQDSQEYGSDDEYMISRVFFTIEVGGERFVGDVDIKQTVGSDYETGPIEIGHPRGYTGPFDQSAFHREVEKYFRGCVGSGASGIRLGPGARNIRMRNNTFVRRLAFDFEADASGRSW